MRRWVREGETVEGVQGQRYLVRRLRLSSCHVEGQHFGREVGLAGMVGQGGAVLTGLSWKFRLGYGGSAEEV